MLISVKGRHSFPILDGRRGSNLPGPEGMEDESCGRSVEGV